MLRTHISSVIDAPIAAVWKTIRPFDSLASWHPYVAACAIEGQRPVDQVGCIRRLELRDGGSIVRETLLALSDVEHRIVYDIIDSPMPVRNYVSTIALHDITEGDRTFAYWSVEFDTPAEKEHEMIAKLEDIYRTGLFRLNQLLGA